MMRQIFLLLGLLICCAKSMAQVPESGRWQELHYSSSEVHLATDLRYQDQVEQLNANRQLDTHKKLIKRVLAITKGLITVAHKMKPETKDWDWKFHISNDLQTEAFCMAGGRVFVGRDFIAKLQLNDAELAVLLAHEMAHAIAEHHREELTEAWHSEIQANLPVEIMLTRLESDFSLQLRMSNLSHTQEREADQLGMLIAHRAGWPASSMVAFYHKLAKHAPANLLTNSHPSAASRLSMAKGMAQLLGD